MKLITRFFSEDEKVKIMTEHILSNMTIVYLGVKRIEFPNVPSLNILDRITYCLRDEDYISIIEKKVFLNIFVNPGSITKSRVQIPENSFIITIDVVNLQKFTVDERIAIVLHEFGHAFGTNNENIADDDIADDFAIDRGYGEALIKSLDRTIKEFSDDYDKSLAEYRKERIIKKIHS